MKVRRWDSVDEFIDTAFEKRARHIKPEFEGSIAVLVPAVVVMKKGAEPSVTAWGMMQDGHYVMLSSKTTRKELLDQLAIELDEDVERADASYDLIDQLELKAPA